jgi:molecular chaperone DnaK
MSADYTFGIDLGTSTSAICAYSVDGGVRHIPDPTSTSRTSIMPSLVAVSTRGSVLVGEPARSTVDLSGRGVREIKRKMGDDEAVTLGDREYRPEEISALILRQLKQNAEAALSTDVEEIVLTVPANFSEPARRATADAVELAGMRLRRLINEPTAAALAYGIDRLDADEQLVVFDFGGGTLDISVLAMVEGILDVQSSYGDPQLGGKDFDQILSDMALGAFYGSAEVSSLEKGSLEPALKSAAERAKIGLSSSESHLIHIPNFATHGGKLLDLDIEVERPQFEAQASNLLARTRECLVRALDAAGTDAEAIDKVLMVGGTTYVPCVRSLVAEVFGVEPTRADIDPDLAVATGAAIHAASAADILDPEKSVILTDVCPFGLGIDIVTESGGQLVERYQPLIDPNTTIPFSARHEYALLHPDQREVEFHLYQDHEGTARIPSDAIDTGIVGRITDIPPALYGNPHPIVVEFQYSIDGMITLAASIPGMSKTVEIRHDTSALRLTDEQKAEARERLDALWQEADGADRYRGIIAKGEDHLEDEHTDTGPELRAAVDGLKSALADGDAGAAESAADSLTDMLFDIENQHT